MDEVAELRAELRVVQAEAVALQAVLIAVCRQLIGGRPELAGAFCQAFDEAENLMSGVAIAMGAEAAIESTVGALDVIGQMRSAVIRDESVCRQS